MEKSNPPYEEPMTQIQVKIDLLEMKKLAISC